MVGSAPIELGDRPVKARLVHHPEHGLVIVEVFGEAFDDRAGDIAELVDRAMCTKHPSLARVHHLARVPEGLEVTSEWIEGESLGDLVRHSNGALSLEVRLRVILDVITALATLHADGVAVGTVSSFSVIVSSDDGVARVTGLHRAPLGVRGMAGPERRVAPPEIELGHDPSAASDVFSVGVMLWEALARRALYDPRGAPAPACAHKWAEPLCELAARCLAIDPEARPRAVAEIAAAIRMVARTRLGSREAVLGAMAEFAMEHVLARRARIARAEMPTDVLTPFEISTAPRGKSVAILEAETKTTPRLAPVLSDHEPAPKSQKEEPGDAEKLTTGAHPKLEPRASHASTGEHELVIVRREPRRPWLALAAAALSLALVIGVAGLIGARPRAPSIAAPSEPSVAAREPAANAAPIVLEPAPSASASQTSTGDSAKVAPTALPTPPAKLAHPRKKPPLRPASQYDPTSI